MTEPPANFIDTSKLEEQERNQRARKCPECGCAHRIKPPRNEPWNVPDAYWACPHSRANWQGGYELDEPGEPLGKNCRLARQWQA